MFHLEALCFWKNWFWTFKYSRGWQKTCEVKLYFENKIQFYNQISYYHASTSELALL